MSRTWITLILLACALSVVRAVTVTGTVLLPDGKPAAGVPVSITDLSKQDAVTKSCTTNGAGVFSAQVAPSNYWYGSATIIAPGCAAYFAYLRKRDTTIHLQREGTLVCRVIDEQGQPVAGATVQVIDIKRTKEEDLYYIESVETLQQYYRFQTGEDGRCVMTGLPQVGILTLVLDDSRFIRDSHDTLLVPDAPPYTITARHGGAIAGKITYADGKPAGGIKVIAEGPAISCTVPETLTAADGTYHLNSLYPTAYTLHVTDAASKGVIAPVKGVKVRIGNATPVDIRLQDGILLTGKVVDAADGKSIPGLDIYCNSSDKYGESYGGTTDAAGCYRIHVLPGKYHVWVSGWLSVAGYLLPPRNTPDLVVNVTAQQMTVPTIKLHKTLTVSGVVTDAQGKPLADQCIGLVTGTNDYQDPFGLTMSDATGHFTVSGLKAGKARIITHPLFEHSPEPKSTPATVQLPMAQPLHVTLGPPLIQPRITGRVVTPDGSPVPGVQVIFSQTHDVSSENPTTESGLSDVNGQFSVVQRRTKGEVKMTDAWREGYRLRSGGKVTKVNGSYQVSDIVLAPLAGKVSGKVVDEHGAPVAGATVFTWEDGLEPTVVTDDRGQFTMSALPEGEVALMAVHQHDFGQVAAKTGEASCAITLVHSKAPAPADTESGLAILEEAWRESPAPEYTILTAIAEHDPDRALKIAPQENGHIAPLALSAIIGSIIHADPAKAATWAPPHLALIASMDDRLSMMILLGQAVVEREPELAAELYRQAKALLKEHHYQGDAAAQYYSGMAKFATQLKSRDAEQFITALCALPNSDPPDRVAMLAAIDQQRAEQAFAKLPASARGEAIADIILALAATDPAAALRWLAKLDTAVDTEAKEMLDNTLVSVVAQVATKFPTEALAMARKVYDEKQRMTALLRVAPFLPKATAIQLYQEAAELVTANPRYKVSDLARIATQVEPLDHALGLSWYYRAKAQLAVAMERAFEPMGSEIIRYAGYSASFAPADSRRLLETLYADHRQRPDSREKTSAMVVIADAMATLDAGRAVEITHAISGEISDKLLKCIALRTIGDYLLTDEAERRGWELQ